MLIALHEIEVQSFVKALAEQRATKYAAASAEAEKAVDKAKAKAEALARAEEEFTVCTFVVFHFVILCFYVYILYRANIISTFK
jgi:hypothetical protein